MNQAREDVNMGKLEGKVAVITAATSGMALATAKLFVEEGAYVFITGRRQEQLDAAVKEIGHNITGVRGDVANLADLDKLYAAVKASKGRVDVLFATMAMFPDRAKAVQYSKPYVANYITLTAPKATV